MTRKWLWIGVLSFGFSVLVSAQPSSQSQFITEKQYIAATQLFDSLFTDRNKRNTFWPPKALSSFQEAKQWAAKQGDAKKSNYADYMLLMYYDNQLQDDEVIAFSERLLQQLPSLESLERANMYQALYNSYDRKGFYRQQLLILDSLIAANKDCNYCIRDSNYQNVLDLAKIYYNLEQYDKAIENYKIQYNAFEAAQNYLRSASMLNNIALSFENNNQADSAFYYYDLASEKITKKGNPDPFLDETYTLHLKNIIASNKASLKLKSSLYPPAETFFKAELVSSKMVKEPRITLSAYAKLANFYVVHNDYPLAKQYLDSAMSFETNYPNPKLKAKLHYTAYQWNIGLQQWEEANQMLTIYLSELEQLQKQKTQNAYLEATAKYKYEEAQQNLQKNKELLLRKERVNAIQAVILITFIIALGIIVYLFRKTQLNSLLINSQKDKLAKGLQEKQMLLDEMHHRTKNNLQIVGGILELQSQKNVNPESYKLLKESQQYLESIAILHKMLYEHNTYEDIDFKTYTENLCHLIISNYPKKDIKYHLEIGQQTFPVGLLTSLGLIQCELLTNSLKHAFNNKGSIEIKHIKYSNKHCVIYRDSGKTFNKDKLQKSKGTGLKLIKSLSEDLEGKYEILNKNGFYFELTFTL